ncbi:hypothetical protein DB41_IB00340 [Neochlamydia sp. TUME1]|nr:hypothetical protein DB41_IB00340 [Neochlamydia sp. TUME1]
MFTIFLFNSSIFFFFSSSYPFESLRLLAHAPFEKVYCLFEEFNCIIYSFAYYLNGEKHVS